VIHSWEKKSLPSGGFTIPDFNGMSFNKEFSCIVVHLPAEMLRYNLRPVCFIFIKVQPDATVCRYLFTAKSLDMFRVSQHPSSGVLKTVTPTSGTGHNTGTATSLQRGLIGNSPDF